MTNFFEAENIGVLAGFDFLDLCLLGETGTGKTYFAERIHRMSPRAAKPFIAVNCAELSPSLVESELFGAEKGAFTGAVATKAGKFEAAHGGTLFLDEVGELPESLQAKLLKVVEEKTVTRVGATHRRQIDVRIIYATHRSLQVFRDDFRFRIARQTIRVPPLRERRHEIAALANRFMEDFSMKARRYIEFDGTALEILSDLDWPGNIRELRAFVERVAVAAVLANPQKGVTPDNSIRINSATLINHATNMQRRERSLTALSALKAQDLSDAGFSMESIINLIEKELIDQALHVNGNNQSRAARLLGISRGGLIKKLKRFSAQ